MCPPLRLVNYKFIESTSEGCICPQSLLELCDWLLEQADEGTMLDSDGLAVTPRSVAAGTLGQAIVTTCSGSGDQQLSDSQQPMITVTKPISSARIMYTSALPETHNKFINLYYVIIKPHQTETLTLTHGCVY